jgi:hypothetical protein
MNPIQASILFAKKKGLVKPEDYIVIASGEMDNLSGTKHNLKIIQVDN